MYTYEDLKERIAVQCNSEEEARDFIRYAEEHGHERGFGLSPSKYMDHYFDISSFKNNGRKIIPSSKKWYELNNYKIINFDELEIYQLKVNIEEFESILMG